MSTESADGEEWVATDHDRVYYKSEADRFGRGEFALAKFVADHIPGWTVLITMGPYRTHDLAYEVRLDEQVINLDCYSAGMAVFGPDISYREEHPAVEHAEALIHDIAKGIKDGGGEFELKETEEVEE